MPSFSSRVQWGTERSRIARALAARHGSILDLTQSNPTDAGLSYPPSLIEALADLRALRYEPTPLGLSLARESISEYYGGAVTSEHLILTASTSEAYSWIFKLLCNAGDEVLVPRPSYPLFEFLAHLENTRVVQYPVRYHEGWYIDLDALRSSVTDRTRAIVFVNPNNPTGSYLKDPEYEFIAGLCEKHSLALVVDEVFLDYSFGNPLRTLAAKHDILTLVMSGLSKVCGLPQMKLGWIAVNGPERDRSHALNGLEWIADTFLSVGAPVQYALPAMLRARTDIQSQIRQRTAANLAHLTRSGARLLPPEGGWYATIQIPRTRSEEDWVLHLIEDQAVQVQPGFFYDFESEAFLILSLLTETGTFEEGLRRTILATI